MAHIRECYAKLQAAFEAQKTDVGADLEKALKELSAKEDELGDRRREMEVRERMIEGLKASDTQKSAEIDRLKRELHESNKKARHLSKEVSRGLQEKDRVLVQVEAERQATQHAKSKLEEEQLAQTKLQEESACREVSLVEAQSRVAYLESEAYRFEVVEEYHQGIFGKAEVAITCKAGYDYLEAQLPAKMRGILGRFHYPPRVANCLDALLDIERQGGGLDLDAGGVEDEGLDDEVDEAPDERIEEGGEGSSGQKSKEADLGASSSPPPPATSTPLPLTPRAGMDFS